MSEKFFNAQFLHIFGLFRRSGPSEAGGIVLLLLCGYAVISNTLPVLYVDEDKYNNTEQIKHRRVSTIKSSSA